MIDKNIRWLNTQLFFRSTTINPNGKTSVFEKKEAIEINNDKKSSISVILHGTSEELLNHEAFRDFDEIMLRLGKSVYPIELQVDGSGEIIKVDNFNDIRKRWKKEGDDILRETESASWVSRYIEASEANLESEENFCQSLRNGTILQLVFIDRSVDELNLCLVNFPKCGSRLPVELPFVKSENGFRHYKGDIVSNPEFCILGGEVLMKAEFSDESDLRFAELRWKIEVENEGYYQKHVQISSIPEIRKVKRRIFA